MDGGDASRVDPLPASADGYPDEAEGVRLHKVGHGSGYKGVTLSRGGPPGGGGAGAPFFIARDGAAKLGTFATRVGAAVAFARARAVSRDVQHHRRQDQRRDGKRKHGQLSARPEEAKPRAASSHYSASEAERYTAVNQQTQHELATRCAELLALPRHALVLDLGCGSCLSSRVLGDAGHYWVGTDVARDMLALAARPRPPERGSLVHSDMAAGLPLRRGCRFDGAISVSALQWLCEPPKDGDAADANAALARLFGDLHRSLAPRAPAAFQFYTTPPLAARARGSVGVRLRCRAAH